MIGYAISRVFWEAARGFVSFGGEEEIAREDGSGFRASVFMLLYIYIYSRRKKRMSRDMHVTNSGWALNRTRVKIDLGPNTDPFSPFQAWL